MNLVEGSCPKAYKRTMSCFIAKHHKF